MRDTIAEMVLRFFSNPFLTAIGMTMVLETTIEGGATVVWLTYTTVVALLYYVANRVHEGTDDMVEDIHDELM